MQTLLLKIPLATKEARVALDPKLPAGRYRVQLVVDGPSGRSAPAALTITLTQRPAVPSDPLPIPVRPPLPIPVPTPGDPPVSAPVKLPPRPRRRPIRP